MALNVGDLIPDQVALAALPVGAAVTENGTQKIWTKHGPNQWGRHQSHRDRYSEANVWYQGQRLLSLPPELYEGPMPGDPIRTVAQLDALPMSATIDARWNEGDERTIFQKDEARRWGTSDDVGYVTPDDILRDAREVIVASLPTIHGETVEQFAWRFRDLAITGAERARGYPEEAIKILERLDSKFEPSVGMVIVNEHDKARLPNGTRVYVGDPDDISAFGVFVKDNGWVHVFGDSNAWGVNPVVRVDALPDTEDPAPWMSRPATVEDAEKIALLRAKAWKVGKAEKDARGWCEEFERIMIRGGIDADSARIVAKTNGIPFGTVMQTSETATMPEGTYFWHGSKEGPWSLFVRSSKARNRAGTTLVMAFEATQTANYATEMVLLGDDEWNFWIKDHAHMDRMPVGTQMLAGGSTYTKARDGKWNPSAAFNDAGQYRADEFGNPAVGRYLIKTILS